MNVFERAENIGVIPVINIADLEVTKPLCETLLENGIDVIEVTLRNENSIEAIKIIRKEFPQMGIAAGTILSLEQAKEALKAGAEALVMPGCDDEIIDYAIENNIPVLPGCITAADIQREYKKGLRLFKFFPSEASGGIPALKLLSGPFKGIKFVPTGGINFDNLGEYLSNEFIAACGGSFMADAKTLKAKDFKKVAELCKKCIDISLGFKLAHIGINHEDKDSADKTAKFIASIFGFDTKEFTTATFAGDVVECMHNCNLGKVGHIGFSTNSIKRAMAYLESKGIELDENGIKRNEKGEITCVYLKENIAGFALHVVQR